MEEERFREIKKNIVHEAIMGILDALFRREESIEVLQDCINYIKRGGD